MPEVQPPQDVSTGCYSPVMRRQLYGTVVCQSGVVLATAAGHFVATGSPALRQVTLTAGQAWIKGTEVANQGTYFVQSNGPVVVNIAAADPVDPRLDRIVARVRDADYSGAVRSWALEVVAGTPSPSPVLPAVPANSISICSVLVPAGAASTPTANLTDLRTQYALCSPNTSGQNPPRTVTFDVTGNFTKAAYPGLLAVTAHVWGAGGGSGGTAATAAGQQVTSAGGGGGGYARIRVPASSLAATETVTVGVGGTAGAAGTNSGGAGGQSQFSTAIAGGGGGGGGGTASASTTILAFGGDGGAPSGVYDLGIQGDAAPWGVTVLGVSLRNGHGGRAPLGAGERLASGAGVGGNSGAPTSPGAGAGGNWRPASQAALAGIAGAAGKVFLELHYQ